MLLYMKDEQFGFSSFADLVSCNLKQETEVTLVYVISDNLVP